MGLDERMLARRREGLDVQRNSARLSIGPRLKLAVAVTDDGSAKGKQRAVPTGTEATIHTSDVTGDASSPQPTERPELELRIRTTGDNTSITDDARSSSTVSITGLDGTHELNQMLHSHRNAAKATVTPCRPGHTVLQELPYAAAGSPAMPSRLLSSARARRPKTRSYEEPIVIHEDKEECAPALDPNATVFTPRVRFGSTTTLVDMNSPSAQAGELRERRMRDHTPTNLALRSASEQNFDPRLLQETRDSSDPGPNDNAGRHHTASPASVAPSPIVYRHSSDAVPTPSPNIERYPMLLPPVSHSGRRRSGTSQSGYTPTRSLPTIPSSPSDNSGVSPVTQVRDSPVATSSVNNSSPLRGVGAAYTPRARMVSAASGISDYDYESPARSFLSARSSIEITDAASEFLRFRSSPLDNLTKELSRLSTALATQTSAPTPCRPNTTALLNGNPFRHSSTATLQNEDSTTSPPASVTTAAVPRTPAPPPPTPRLPIYNDALPPSTQPQTPADLPPSAARRTRNRSDSAVHSPLPTALPGSVSVRRNRNTYPSSSSGSGENDLDGLVAGLEAERSVWLGRIGEMDGGAEGGGGLETTPPGVGRMERFVE